MTFTWNVTPFRNYLERVLRIIGGKLQAIGIICYQTLSLKLEVKTKFDIIKSGPLCPVYLLSDTSPPKLQYFIQVSPSRIHVFTLLCMLLKVDAS
jgi:hypothetical protein